jgi:hypothetical protein
MKLKKRIECDVKSLCLNRSQKIKIVYPLFWLCARKIKIISASKKAIKIDSIFESEMCM